MSSCTEDYHTIAPFHQNATCRTTSRARVRKSDFGLMFSWVKIPRNNLLFLICTGKKISFFGFA
jgi:hypothetical protein